ncbi:Phospholipase ddhd1 [Mortierella claussenii]|nr:Phospholipase ddhd1 [Mortierella claussenii]
MSHMPATMVAVDNAVNNTGHAANTGASTPSHAAPASANSKDSSPKVSPMSNPAPASAKKTFKPDQYPHHVIFVVHGMGRQLEEFGNYERNVGYLVENTKTVLQSQFHELQTDVHIIPIEWHAKLHSMVDQRMALAMRVVMNDYFADILYYFNNHFGSEIVRMIVDELNEAYSTFIAKHPDFNGKIAVYALSLGGVAMFDILTCMDDDETEEEERKRTGSVKNTGATTERTKETPLDPSAEAKRAEDTSSATPAKKIRIRKQDQPKFRAIVPKLNFRPNILFTVGSPVGAVMVMRNLDWDTFHPPDDILHHNIFHPFDPLAYRIEPLIDPIFAAIPAVTLTSTGNSQLFPISLPSLASLPSIPGTISSFWENKLPALPRPSIPKLSTLSQMTQSLKAGRWLGGTTESGNARADASTEQRTDGGMTSNESGGESATEEHTSSSSIKSNVNAGKKHYHGSTREGDLARKLHKPYSGANLTTDSDVSLTEAIAAATVATYLDHRDGGNGGPSRSATPSDPEESHRVPRVTSATTSTATVPPTPSRRPSLGPHQISSRVEDEQQNPTSATSPIKMDAEAGEEDYTLSTTQAAETTPQNMADIPALQMEYYLGMEKGPSEAEKAQGEGAKSNVVQEPIVRSVPTSPEADSHIHHAHNKEGKPAEGEKGRGIEDMQAAHELKARGDQDDKSDAKEFRKVTLADEEDDGHEDKQSTVGEKSGDTDGGTVKVEEVDTSRTPLQVGGRETKVPYRIDHILQETRVDQYTNEYLLGMRSHFRYWGNRDIAYHILKTMLRPNGDSSDGDVLDLQPEMPSPVTAPKSVKEAAEAKAKAAAAAYRRSQDLGHRKAFSLSSTSTPSNDTATATAIADANGGNRRQRGASGPRYPGDGRYNGSGDDNERQLYGYRYEDLDMSSAANVAFSGSSGSTLYQNSPFVKNSWESSSPRPTSDAAVSAAVDRDPKLGGHRMPTSRPQRQSMDLRRSSGSYTGAHAQGHGSSGVAAASGTTPDQPINDSATSSATTTAFEEGIIVPDLARPPRLHHRSSRVE